MTKIVFMVNNNLSPYVKLYDVVCMKLLKGRYLYFIVTYIFNELMCPIVYLLKKSKLGLCNI